MTEAKLIPIAGDEARALREAATDGPWEWSIYFGRHPARLCTSEQARSGNGWILQLDREKVNAGVADLIAAAPELAYTVEVLEAQLKEARAKVAALESKAAMYDLMVGDVHRIGRVPRPDPIDVAPMPDGALSFYDKDPDVTGVVIGDPPAEGEGDPR